VSEARNLDDTKQRVLVVGLGTMGLSRARAYRAIGGFDLVGLCTFDAAARHDLDQEFPGIPRYERLTEALQAHKPDAVAISTYTEHHAPMALEPLRRRACVLRKAARRHPRSRRAGC
jgi:predicted dehydrogenase